MRATGMTTFIVIWLGQFVSRIGTAMTRFALLIWAYQQTGDATTVALLGFFAFVPLILVSPFAGVWVDRLDRRKVMLLADLGAGLMTAGMLLLFATGTLHIWHLYLAEALSGAFEAFQAPAYTAASTVLLSKNHYARASGLRSVANWGAQIISPLLAGFLLVWSSIAGIMIIDLATFLVALITLLIIRVPRVVGDAGAATPARGQFWPEMRVGFQYVWERSGLLGLMLIFTGIHFLASLTWSSILPAMVLARSGARELALANVQGAMGAGGVIGGLFVSVWGGPKRKIHGVLAGAALSFLLGDFLLGVGRGLSVWVVGASIGAFFIPFVFGSDQAIWQAKVHPAVQGRVFSVYDMVCQSLMPLGYLLAGPLADDWLGPAMMPEGSLAPLFGPLVGSGPGAGMALMFVGTAVSGCLMSLLGYLIPSVRRVEDELPDHDFAPKNIGVPESQVRCTPAIVQPDTVGLADQVNPIQPPQ
jgi:DHA3 family macrolide efflux protein-like MFS transporter